MPTSRASAPVVVPRGLKLRLDAVKGRDTYGELLEAALRLAPPPRIRAWLDARRDVARRAAGSGARPRETAKQLLVARLAAERRRAWRARGRLVDAGPRRTRWNLDESLPSPPVEVRVARRPRAP